MLAATYKDVAFGIVMRAEAISQAWAAIKAHYQPDTSNEVKTHTREFMAMTPEWGEEPIMFISG